VTSEVINRRNPGFQLFEALTQRSRFADHSRETFSAVLDTAHAIAEEKSGAPQPQNRQA
jgi:hypothetical protein